MVWAESQNSVNRPPSNSKRTLNQEFKNSESPIFFLDSDFLATICFFPSGILRTGSFEVHLKYIKNEGGGLSQ